MAIRSRCMASRLSKRPDLLKGPHSQAAHFAYEFCNTQPLKFTLVRRRCNILEIWHALLINAFSRTDPRIR